MRSGSSKGQKVIGYALGKVVSGVVWKLLAGIVVMPMLMNGLASCTGGKAEGKRALAAYHETVEQLDRVGIEVHRLREYAKEQEANSFRPFLPGEEERKLCEPGCLLLD